MIRGVKMSEFDGIIERISKKEKGWAVLIDGNWYSGREGQCPIIGTHIKGEYITKDWNGKIFRNIKSFSIVSFPVPQPGKSDDSSTITMIHRQSALKCASLLISAYMHNTKTNINEAEILTIQLADKFVEYIESGYNGEL